MKTSKFAYMTALALFLVTALGHTATAQQVPQTQQQPVKEDFKTEELQSFIKAYGKVMAIQQETEKQMIDTIKAEGLTVERFNQLAEAQQNPAKKVEANEKEKGSFNNIAQKLATVNQSATSKMEESIKTEGLDIQTYQQIILAYQQIPKVKKALDDLLPKPSGTADTTTRMNN